jgi:hypothetical protein
MSQSFGVAAKKIAKRVFLARCQSWCRALLEAVIALRIIDSAVDKRRDAEEFHTR